MLLLRYFDKTMRKKLMCLQGIPASWKTTWAKKFCKRNKNWVRINKDDIREGMWITYSWTFDKKLEETVVQAERNMVQTLLDSGHNVMVDNTHLLHRYTHKNKHLDYYEQLAKDNNVRFEVKTFVVDVDEAIERDKNRKDKDPVGKEVFDKFKKIFIIPTPHPINPVFKSIDKSLPFAIICDLDWTLAFMNGKRSPYDYSKVEGDDVNHMLKIMLDVITANADVEIIFLSGRKEECALETKNWLTQAWYPNNRLFMRNKGDNRCDSIVKKELYDNSIKWHYNVLAVFDDRNRVVDMWRQEWLPTYQVWYGDF